MCFEQTMQDDAAPDLGNPQFPATAPQVGAGPSAGPEAPDDGSGLSKAGAISKLIPTLGKPGGGLNKTTGAAKGAVGGAVAGAPLGPAGIAIGAVLGALPSLFSKKPARPMMPVSDPSPALANVGGDAGSDDLMSKLAKLNSARLFS